jgi:VanZ family protein
LSAKLYQLLRRKGVWWALFALWLAAVFFASSLTGDEVRPYVPTFTLHKLGHLLAYSSGAVILALGWRCSTRWSWRKIVIVSVVMVSVYGATDEWHQSFTPGRGPSAWDWLLDTVSGLAGISVLLLARRRLQRWLGTAAAKSATGFSPRRH